METTWSIRVDTGGTFTDAWARDLHGNERRIKVLSDGSLVLSVLERGIDGWLTVVSPFELADDVLVGFRSDEGHRVVSNRDQGRRIQLDGSVKGERITLRSGEEPPVVAARLLMGVPVSRKLPPLDFRVATTRGTNALLERKGAPTALFITRGFTDLPILRDQRRQRLFSVSQPEPEVLPKKIVGICGRLDALGNTLEGPDETEVRALARECLTDGIRVAAVALLHAWRCPQTEERVAGWLLDEGFESVSTSSSVAPLIGFLGRMETAVADAWLSPVMQSFIDGIRSAMASGEPTLMTSAGGLVPASSYRAKDSLLSGPAGGLVGAASVARAAGFSKVIAFDMGGTSTDVARIDGPFSYRYDQEIGPARVMAPALRIHTVAAGGGSICRWHLGRLEVGPESAGASPGPACYGRGGPLTVTDVNLLLGLMDPDRAGIPLDPEPSRQRLRELMAAMSSDGIPLDSEQELLEGLRRIAIETMAEAIRTVTVGEGALPGDHVLLAFGGAGPQHACALADRLGMKQVIVPGDAGLLSARGLDRARRQETAARQVLQRLSGYPIESVWVELQAAATERFGMSSHRSRWLASLCLEGQGTSIEVELDSANESEARLSDGFHAAYQKLYGFPPATGRAIELVSLRVIVEEDGSEPETERFATTSLAGPVMHQDRFSTCVVPAGWSLRHGDKGSFFLEKTTNDPRTSRSGASGIEDALFRSRFEGIVGDMGALLKRTALSTNIRERLDYSCALLDADGRLVVSAPHVPVHLGALGVCVREVASRLELAPGDRVVVNHPAAGGSHLPDVTVIGAAFDPVGRRIGYVANRAHHAEIGGMAPGSMPAAARCLAEEGVVIPPLKFVEAGVSRIGKVEDLLRGGPFPSRRPEENLADLEAQAASVNHGLHAVEALAASDGGDFVRERMNSILERSSLLMRTLLTDHEGFAESSRTTVDDGTPIAVRISVSNGRMTLDFTGSGAVHPRNLNATPAILRSVVLFVIRLWLDADVPLNEGLLEPVEIILPTGFLNPDFPDDPAKCPAVVGGNVETSQRVADVLLSALGLSANGPGTMNNFLFGNAGFGYYETISGGSGAGPHHHGCSGRHVHMTNTAITDPEVLEHRFPVRLHRYELRRGSGGKGQHSGGDGVIREIGFLEPLTVSFLTERRETSPDGLGGGGNGAPGSQTRLHPDGRMELLPGAITYQAEAGESVIIETPGGGGWGAESSAC